MPRCEDPMRRAALGRRDLFGAKISGDHGEISLILAGYNWHRSLRIGTYDQRVTGVIPYPSR